MSILILLAAGYAIYQNYSLTKKVDILLKDDEEFRTIMDDMDFIKDRE